MERFTVTIETEDKEFIHKYEEMRFAKSFAQRAYKLKGNETCNITITDNRVNQTPYYHYQKDGVVFRSNL